MTRSFRWYELYRCRVGVGGRVLNPGEVCEMSFNDEELRSLKYNVENYSENNKHGWFLDIGEWKALLARLEAAEKFCEYVPECNCGQECDYHTDAMKAWRKAAGKD